MQGPDFLIIGAQKAGTTSLFQNLLKHPEVCLPETKELHFFDANFYRGPQWYVQQFPSRMNVERKITGEATPYYLFHPRAAERCFALFPDVRLIVMLRNPVDRAFSHYNHSVRSGREQASFSEALGRENSRLKDETARMIADRTYVSVAHRVYSYVARGMYVDQLGPWVRRFGCEKILLVCTEELDRSPEGEYARIYEFLGIERSVPSLLSRSNVGDYCPMAIEDRARLNSFFAMQNARLYRFCQSQIGFPGGVPAFSSFWDAPNE